MAEKPTLPPIRFDRDRPMTPITPEQRLALAEAGDSAIEVADPVSGDAFVLVRAKVYREMRD